MQPQRERGETGRGNTLNVTSPITPETAQASAEELRNVKARSILHRLAAETERTTGAIDENGRRG